MKSWMKYGLAGALVLMASFWGGSVRAAEISFRPLSGVSDTVVDHPHTAPVRVDSVSRRHGLHDLAEAV